jgi:hypothetical protein
MEVVGSERGNEWVRCGWLRHIVRAAVRVDDGVKVNSVSTERLSVRRRHSARDGDVCG